MTAVYFMPGMAASPDIFSNIKLPVARYSCHYLNWIPPQPNESVYHYSRRLCDQVVHKNPILIGVSFGGMIVQEMARSIDAAQVVIISTARSHLQYPRRMKIARKYKLYRFLPTGLIKHAEFFARHNFGFGHKKLQLYYKYLGVNDKEYLDWALKAIITWENHNTHPHLLHIHGDADPVFPIKYIDGAVIVPGGTHIMTVNRFRWFNDHLGSYLVK